MTRVGPGVRLHWDEDAEMLLMRWEEWPFVEKLETELYIIIREP